MEDKLTRAEAIIDVAWLAVEAPTPDAILALGLEILAYRPLPDSEDSHD